MKHYEVKVNGKLVLKTESRTRAERCFGNYIGKNGEVLVDTVELVYPDFVHGGSVSGE